MACSFNFSPFFRLLSRKRLFFSPLQSQKGFRKYNCAHKMNQNIAGTCCVLCAQPSESSELEHYKIINLLFSASATACNHLIFISAMKTLLFFWFWTRDSRQKKYFVKTFDWGKGIDWRSVKCCNQPISRTRLGSRFERVSGITSTRCAYFVRHFEPSRRRENLINPKSSQSTCTLGWHIIGKLHHLCIHNSDTALIWK